MRRQVSNNGGEVVVIGVEFVVELIVEIFFDGSDIKSDNAREAKLGEVRLAFAVSEEGFGEVFSELRPDGTDCSTVRVEDTPTVAVIWIMYGSSMKWLRQTWM